MKKMKLWSLTLAAVLILSASALTACAKGEAGGDPQGEDPGDGKTDYDVTLYYVNEEYAVSGDESLSHLIPVEGLSLIHIYPAAENMVPTGAKSYLKS